MAGNASQIVPWKRGHNTQESSQYAIVAHILHETPRFVKLMFYDLGRRKCQSIRRAFPYAKIALKIYRTDDILPIQLAEKNKEKVRFDLQTVIF